MTPLPDTSRLLAVWNGAQPEATSLEHTTRAYLTLWTMYLLDVDHTQIGDWQYFELPDTATGGSRVTARMIDDEISWHLGNRPDVAVLVDDHVPGRLTAGELVGRLAMFTVLFDKWPPTTVQCPIGPAFMGVGRQFDRLMQGLSRGRRQPRRRADGLSPVAQPQRIEPGVPASDRE
ncbi:hypothetical protein AB0I35_12815 [Nocardia sp. NPDC050378]|uniref:hypothetical protein n=1 Tax=Nocardia sp. NPDC050378 TaxID=3155400 RepID=UPI0033E3D35D